MLQSELEAKLGCKRLCLKTINPNSNQSKTIPNALPNSTGTNETAQ